MEKIKSSKSKTEDLSLQKKLSMFYIEELEDRLEMAAIAAVNESCWGEDGVGEGGDGGDINHSC